MKYILEETNEKYTNVQYRTSLNLRVTDTVDFRESQLGPYEGKTTSG